MGVEFHITRADFWADNQENQISSEEWLETVNADPELTIDDKNGEFFVIWNGDSIHKTACLEWSAGNVSTKWPDTALYHKMLKIAEKLNAKVMDDNGTLYESPESWDYAPTNAVVHSTDEHYQSGSRAQRYSTLSNTIRFWKEMKFSNLLILLQSRWDS